MPVIPSDPPFTFQIFSGVGTIARFWTQGVRLQDFRREAPENRTEGSVLENYGDFDPHLTHFEK